MHAHMWLCIPIIYTHIQVSKLIYLYYTYKYVCVCIMNVYMGAYNKVSACMYVCYSRG